MARKLRIGILGGSFDPIHVGHVSIARQVADRLDLDELILVPAGRPPHKTPGELAPAADRLAMARLAVRGLGRLSVSDVEVRREGPSYTIDTVRELRESLGPAHDCFFVIGADTVAELPSWHRAEELVAEMQFAIVQRPGHEADFAPVKQTLGPEAAALLRRGVVEIEPCDVSSTRVRELVAAGGNISGLVHADVAAYITANELYR